MPRLLEAPPTAVDIGGALSYEYFRELRNVEAHRLRTHRDTNDDFLEVKINEVLEGHERIFI